MSASYYWRPVVPPPPPGGDLSSGMADLLLKHILGDWGSRSELVGQVLDESHVGWLTGVRDAREDDVREEAQSLLDGIAEHGRIEVQVER